MLKDPEKLKLDFIQRVVSESNELTACIAKIALTNNEIDQFFEILQEQHKTNPELFKKMIGYQVYSSFLEVLNTRQ